MCSKHWSNTWMENVYSCSYKFNKNLKKGMWNILITVKPTKNLSQSFLMKTDTVSVCVFTLIFLHMSAKIVTSLLCNISYSRLKKIKPLLLNNTSPKIRNSQSKFINSYNREGLGTNDTFLESGLDFTAHVAAFIFYISSCQELKLIVYLF